MSETKGQGVDLSFDSSGSPSVFPDILRVCRRSAPVVLIGMPNAPVLFDIPLLQMLGITIKTVFRYRNCFDRALALMSSGKIDVDRLIGKVFSFEESIEAYEFAAERKADVIKVMIDF